MLSRLVALLARPWAPLTVALIGVALTLPALGAGLILDDYFHRAILLGVGPFGRDARPVFDLFSFVPKGPRHEAASTIGLLVLHGPVAALLLVQGVVMLPLLNTPLAAVAARSSAAADGPRRATVFVNGLEPFVAALPIVQGLETPGAATQRIALLASMFDDNVAYREAADTLVITAQGGFLRTLPDQLFRSAGVPFRIGEQIERADFTAEVRAVTPDGRPEQVAFRFHLPLESPEYRWLAWSPKGVDEFRLPPVRSQIDLPRVEILTLARALGRERFAQKASQRAHFDTPPNEGGYSVRAVGMRCQPLCRSPE